MCASIIARAGGRRRGGEAEGRKGGGAHCALPPATYQEEPVTALLYQTESYLRETDARVTGHAEINGTPAVVLDRTVFYPGGGGQPADTGTLAWAVEQATI